MIVDINCCNPFLGPRTKKEKIQKKKVKKIYSKEKQNIIAVKKGFQNARKTVGNWLRRFKIQRLEFDSILLTGESPIDKEN
jgi:hypothetical protein